MYKDSYDIPAYKFALIRSKSSELETIESNINDFKNTRVFSFDDLDGLTIREIDKMIYLNDLKFICYYSVDELKFSLNQILNWSKSNLNYHYLFSTIKYVLDLNDLEASDKRIDEVIEEKLMAAYPSASFEEKKIFNCFFERYQDRTHEDTVQRVYKMNGLKRK